MFQKDSSELSVFARFPCLLAGLMSLMCLILTGCAPPKPATTSGGVLTPDQAAFEMSEQDRGSANLYWNFPAGGGTLRPNINYIYALYSGGLSRSPRWFGPQVETPVFVSLDSALPIMELAPARVVRSGRVWLEPMNAKRQVSYNRQGVQVDTLADDGQTVVTSSLYSDFSRVNLEGFINGLPEELNAAIPVKKWIGFNNLAGNANWESGATYTKKKGQRAIDTVLTFDCTNNPTPTPTPTLAPPSKPTATSPAADPMPRPCRGGSSLDHFFPFTLAMRAGHPSETDFVADGSISTMEGVRMWIAHQPRPLVDQTTLGYRVFFELNNNVYAGVLEKAGTRYLYRQDDGTIVDYGIVLNRAAVESLSHALITGVVQPNSPGSTVDAGDAGAPAATSGVDLFGLGGHGVNGSLSPSDLRKHYRVPETFNGAGQTIAVVDAPGSGDPQGELRVFSEFHHLPICNADNPCFQHIDLSHGATVQSTFDWGSEVAMDTQALHAIAPAAKIILVTSASHMASDMMAAVRYAAALPNVLVVSMSFSYSLTANDRTAVDQLLGNLQTAKGLIYFASSGDAGFLREPGYPAASPYVTGVGGTRIASLDWSLSDRSELAWQYSGGGASSFVSMPSWQQSLLSQQEASPPDGGFRAVPDVAAVADYQHSAFGVYHKGGWLMMGGTSLSTPIWAGLSALLAESLARQGKSLSALVKSTDGGFNAILYQIKTKANSEAFRDILYGTNNLTSSSCRLCLPGPGYNNITGIGVPDAASLFSNFSSFFDRGPGLAQEQPPLTAADR